MIDLEVEKKQAAGFQVAPGILPRANSLGDMAPHSLRTGPTSDLNMPQFSMIRNKGQGWGAGRRKGGKDISTVHFILY